MVLVFVLSQTCVPIWSYWLHDMLSEVLDDLWCHIIEGHDRNMLKSTTSRIIPSSGSRVQDDTNKQQRSQTYARRELKSTVERLSCSNGRTLLNAEAYPQRPRRLPNKIQSVRVHRPQHSTSTSIVLELYICTDCCMIQPPSCSGDAGQQGP